MSFSNPQLTNPAQHFFRWKGGEGKLEFYNKEKEETVTVPLPFEFIPIDELATVSGYSKMAKSGYYSNEVRSTLNDELVVKLKGQTVFTGLYKNDQGIAQLPKGASYTTSLYVAHKNKAGEYIIGNIKITGSALGPWIEFNKGKVIGNGKVVMTKGAEQDSPVGKFYPPKFTYESLTDEDYKAAMDADKELQIYLSQYLSAPKEQDTPPPVEDDTTNPPEDKSIVEEYANTQTKSDEEIVIEDMGGEPINLDDIPF